MIYFGRVEQRDGDYTRNMRYRVRVLGVHSENVSELPTADLPWATPIQNNSAAMSGIGESANGYLQGSTVAVMFLDSDFQIPIILGAIAGIDEKPLTGNEAFKHVEAELDIRPTDTKPADPEENYIGSLSITLVRKMIESLPIVRNVDKDTDLGYAIGRHLHREDDLITLGYLNSVGNWTGKNGIKHRNEYLGNQSIQDDAEETLLKLYYTDLVQRGILTSHTPKEKTAGILSVRHLGIDAVTQLLQGGNPSVDGQSALTWYKQGYKIIVGKETAEHPTNKNLNFEASDLYDDIQTSKDKNDVNPREKALKKQGFIDPDLRYPLTSHVGEPDSPRLATGIKASQTLLGLKTRGSASNIKIANSNITWNQSPQPYNAVYPYNHVTQTESGHVFELDDSPGAERIHLGHRTGTFFEVDSFGNSVDKSVGIKTIIVDKDELVYVKGSGHVTVDGDLTVRVGKSCQIEVIGDANIKVNGNLTTSVAGAYNISAGSFTVNADKYIIGGTDGTITGSTVKLNAPNILQNPVTGDIVFGGHSQSDTSVGVSMPTYSTTIQTPAPITRTELLGIELEETTVSARLLDKPGTFEHIETDSTPSANSRSLITSKYKLPAQIDLSTQLTANYKLGDLAVGNIGRNFPFNGQHQLTAVQIAENLRSLALNVLEPIREHALQYGMILTSVIRPAGNPYSLPDRISQHELGMAADMSFSAFRGRININEEFYNMARWIKDNILFDQLLLEYRSGGVIWIHVSFNANNNRKQIKTMVNDKTYGSGLSWLEEI